MIVDLRSDTVTLPSKQMKEAMMNAPLGDDVFGEDPTILQLEKYAAELFGMEAALFCPSGTMTNQIAIQVHTSPGQEIICEQDAHIYNYETGGIAANSMCQVRTVKGKNGKMTASQVQTLIQPEYDWLAPTGLISIENTTNKGGGYCYTRQEIEDLYTLSQQHNLPFHIDGARIFNAFAVEDYDPLFVGKNCDSLSICLSKGLGAPVGSILLGSSLFIKKARKTRKRFGGGMRQAGILAAAGLFALQNHVEDLKDDHEKIIILAKALQAHPKVEKIIDPQTNILIFELKEEYGSEDFINALKAHGVLISQMSAKLLRMVCHRNVEEDMLNYVTKLLPTL